MIRFLLSAAIYISCALSTCTSRVHAQTHGDFTELLGIGNGAIAEVVGNQRQDILSRFADDTEIARLPDGHLLIHTKRKSQLILFDQSLQQVVHTLDVPAHEQIQATQGRALLSSWNKLTEVTIGANGLRIAREQEPEFRVLDAIPIDTQGILTLSLSDNSPAPTGTIFNQGVTTSYSIDFLEEANPRHHPRLSTHITDATRVALWDNAWQWIYLCRIESGRLMLESKVRAHRPLSVALQTGGRAIWVDEQFSIWESDGSKSRRLTNFPFPVRKLVASGEAALIQYIRRPDAVWPQSRGPLPQQSTVSWVMVAPSLLAGLLIGVLLRSRVLQGDQPHPISTDGAGTSAGKSILFLGTVAVASLLLGDVELGKFWPGWGGIVAIGAGLLISGRAFFNTISTPLPPAANRRTASLIAGACIASSMTIFYLANQPELYSLTVGVWGGTVVALSICCFPQVPKNLTSPLQLAWPLIPLLIATVTLWYKLPEIPNNMHFDFAYDAYDGIRILEGRVPNIWHNGFVPAPVIGKIPEIIGLLLFEPTPLGFRFGPTLLGFVTLIIVYRLGLILHGPVAGYAAALLLSANPIFTHFYRQPATGTSTTLAVAVLYYHLRAIQTGGTRHWLTLGVLSGLTFYCWPIGRPAVLAAGIGTGIMLISKLRRACNYIPSLICYFSAVAVFISPLIPLWIMNPTLLFPRVNESMTFVTAAGSESTIQRFIGSLGEPLLRSLGWFSVYGDQSTQGTLSPALNQFETILLLTCIIPLLWSALKGRVFPSILVLIYLLLYFIICGAWADNPPYYTRMLATLFPAICLMGIAAARALQLHVLSRIHEALPYAIVTLTLLPMSVLPNFDRYVTYELSERPSLEMTAIGRAVEALGPSYQYFLLITGRPDLSINLAERTGRLGEWMPHIWNLTITEIQDLDSDISKLNVPHAVLIVPEAKLASTLVTLREQFPKLRLEQIDNRQGAVVAGLIFPHG